MVMHLMQKHPHLDAIFIQIIFDGWMYDREVHLNQTWRLALASLSVRRRVNDAICFTVTKLSCKITTIMCSAVGAAMPSICVA